MAAIGQRCWAEIFKTTASRKSGWRPLRFAVVAVVVAVVAAVVVAVVSTDVATRLQRVLLLLLRQKKNPTRNGTQKKHNPMRERGKKK